MRLYSASWISRLSVTQMPIMRSEVSVSPGWKAFNLSQKL